MILEGARTSIGLLWSQYHFRNNRDRITTFTNAVSSAKQALIIMPLYRREFLPTVMVIELLRKKFSEENLTFVSTDHGLEAMRLLPHSQFIHILPSEVSVFLVPGKDLVERIRKKKYDLAVDLNLDLVLPSGYICKASEAKVRVGFSGKRADTFYNFQVHPDLTLGRKLIYDRLVKCLKMF